MPERAGARTIDCRCGTRKAESIECAVCGTEINGPESEAVDGRYPKEVADLVSDEKGGNAGVCGYIDFDMFCDNGAVDYPEKSVL